MVELTSFLAQIKCCEQSKLSSSKTHSFHTLEDTIAFYYAMYPTNKDTLDLLVLKLNRLLPSTNKLTLSSFECRVNNMMVEIGLTGRKNNSQQGRDIAKYLNGLYRNKLIDKQHFRTLINTHFNEQLI